MSLPTEPIGSIPRPLELIEAAHALSDGDITPHELEPVYREALGDTIARFEATGSPVISDGEQRKFHNFATYAVHGAPNLAPDGFELRFLHHVRRWPRLTAGPFHCMRNADQFLVEAGKLTTRPVKQAVIAPSALSLMYPPEDLDDYSRDEFLASVVSECASEIRACLAHGAHTVQMDFTEGRLAYKLDPSGELLNSFIGLTNMALRGFSAAARRRIGVHTCPGGDRDSKHSLDVDYAELLPQLFELDAGSFFVALAREADRPRVLRMIAEYLKPHQRVFVGVVDVLNPQVDTPEEVCERVLEAAEFIPLHQLGTTDDCGYSPFADDLSTSRDTAFCENRGACAWHRDGVSQTGEAHVSAADRSGSPPAGGADIDGTPRVPQRDLLQNIDEGLRKAALRTSSSILSLQRRAEEQLLEAQRTLQTQADALAESNMLLHTALESSPVGIMAVNRAGRITAFNTKVAEMFHVSVVTRVRRDFAEWTGTLARQSVDSLTVLARLRQLINAESNVSTQGTVELSGGRVLEYATAPLLRDGTASGVVLNWLDVSDRRRAETEQSSLQEQLRESQKMESIGSLAGGITHDFNDILGAILGNIMLARQALADGQPIDESLASIQVASERATRLVQQILTFSRRQRQRVERLALPTLLSEAGNLLRATIPSGISIELSVDETAPEILGDPTQLHQVIMNLGSNAMNAVRERTGIDGGTGRISSGWPARIAWLRLRSATAPRSHRAGMPCCRWRTMEWGWTTRPGSASSSPSSRRGPPAPAPASVTRWCMAFSRRTRRFWWWRQHWGLARPSVCIFRRLMTSRRATAVRARTLASGHRLARG